jgi:RNA polymerase sigma factor for flagellar operon FliA
LFLDHRISAWGKWRPSSEARRAGSTAILLEQLMVRDGYAFEEACEMLRTNHGVAADRGELERLAALLPVRVRRRFEPDEALENMPSQHRSVDDLAADRDRRATGERVSEALASLMARMDLQDRLILALRFEDGRTVAEIATMLQLDQKALYRRVERLLKELRTGLEAGGIDGASVLEMLESPAVSFEWRHHADAEKATARPSMSKGAAEWR